MNARNVKIVSTDLSGKEPKLIVSFDHLRDGQILATGVEKQVMFREGRFLILPIGRGELWLTDGDKKMLEEAVGVSRASNGDWYYNVQCGRNMADYPEWVKLAGINLDAYDKGGILFDNFTEEEEAEIRKSIPRITTPASYRRSGANTWIPSMWEISKGSESVMIDGAWKRVPKYVVNDRYVYSSIESLAKGLKNMFTNGVPEPIWNSGEDPETYETPYTYWKSGGR